VKNASRSKSVIGWIVWQEDLVAFVGTDICLAAFTGVLGRLMWFSVALGVLSNDLVHSNIVGDASLRALERNKSAPNGGLQKVLTCSWTEIRSSWECSARMPRCSHNFNRMQFEEPRAFWASAKPSGKMLTRCLLSGCMVRPFSIGQVSHLQALSFH
jgi:hypothetical protein